MSMLGRRLFEGYLSTSLIGVTMKLPSGPTRCLKMDGRLRRCWLWLWLSPNETSDRLMLYSFRCSRCLSRLTQHAANMNSIHWM